MRTVFPNNTVPASRFDFTGAKIMGLYPMPNLPGVANNYGRIHTWSHFIDDNNPILDTGGAGAQNDNDRAAERGQRGEFHRIAAAGPRHERGDSVR